MKRVLALCAALLSACYASRPLLLDPDAAAHPLADGVYARDGAPADRYRLTLEPDGWYDVEPVGADGRLGQTRHALVNAMDPVAGHTAYAVAVENTGLSDEDAGFTYLTALVDGPRVYLATPDCGDPLDRNLAIDQGGQPSDDDAMTRNCNFQDRGALLAALDAFAGQAEFGSPFQKH